MTDETVKKEQPKARIKWAKIGIFFSTIGILILICAFSYGYFQLAQVNIALAQMLAEQQNKVETQQTQLNDVQNSVTAIQQASEKSQQLSAEQAQLMSEWRAAQQGDLNKWHLAEAQYLVKLANDHLQFTHNIAMALTLLASADKILEKLPDALVLEVRKAIATDIANLQALPKVDVTALYLQLSAINNQIDQLPLPATPLKQTDEVDNTKIRSDLPWWKVGWRHTWQALQKIVIVRYNGSDTLPLILPEEKNFLYQNLHAQIEDAMWGLLHHHAEIYQSSLSRSQLWVSRYFVQDAPLSKEILQKLQVLNNVDIRMPASNLATTLQLFDHYFAQPEQAKTAQ